MNFLLALLIGATGLWWTWGALTGRLASMIAALVNPAWLVGGPAQATSTGSSGAPPVGVPPAGAGGY